MATQIQTRRDTSANWASVNPILLEGEMGYETDTLKLKVGDGVSLYTALEYTINQSNTADFVATGTIGAADVVGLRSDGTVEVIAGTYVPSELGTSVVFESASTSYMSSVYDSTNNKVIISYGDNGNGGYGTVVVGTISGTVITFGTPQVFQSTFTPSISLAYDSTNNKVIISYSNGNNGNGTAIVGTVSGTVITFGTPQVFDSNFTSDMSSVYDSTNNKVIISYVDMSNNYGIVIVGTISGTVITFGTTQVFNSTYTFYISSAYDSTNNKIIISYSSGGSGFGTAIAGTISGTVITFGTPQVFESTFTSSISSVYDSTNNKVIISYSGGDNSYGIVIVGTISGTVITFGTSQVFNSASSAYISSAYDSTNNKVIISYRNSGNSGYGTVIVGTVSGTVITFGIPEVFNSASSSYVSSASNSTNNKVIISYRNSGNNSYGTAVVYSTLELTTNVASTIGISTTAKVNGETAAITIIGGVSAGHSALTIGDIYYTDFNGVISTATDPITGFKRLGVAISTTEILLDSQY